MGLALIQKSFLQHVIAKLQLFHLTQGLKQLAFVAGQDLLHVAAVTQILPWLFLLSEAEALEGFSHLQGEALEQLDVVLILRTQELAFLFEVLNDSYISVLVLLDSYNSRLSVPFSLRKVANSFLNVLFWRLSSSTSLISSFTNGPIASLICSELMESCLGGGDGSISVKSSIWVIRERSGSNSDWRDAKVF